MSIVTKITLNDAASSMVKNGFTRRSDNIDIIRNDISKNSKYIKNLERHQRRKCWMNSRYKKR